LGKQRLIIVSGTEFRTISEACSHFDVSVGSFYYQEKRGVPLEDIFLKSKKKGTPKRNGITADYNFSVCYPNIMPEWCTSLNSGLDPKNVAPKSGKKAWWKCRIDPSHVWETAIRNRADGKGCPFCSGKITTERNSLLVNQPEIAMEYASDLNIRPIEELSSSNGIDQWWRCAKGHEWKARPADRVRDKSGCPYCSGSRATPENNFFSHFPELAKCVDLEAHPELKLVELLPCSSKKVWL
jgi:hypothetical protein